ncbi:MAG: hypothetical protein IKX71_04290 [Bacteroidales bacterium]|nr:hypothetical protein [Bacteroidales bacterium]
MDENGYYYYDDEYGERLLISREADKRELHGNIRAAKAILNSFSNVTIAINPHSKKIGTKNPEYTVEGLLGDRKGIMSEKGVTAGFRSAKRQGCKVVVIDLDENVGTVRPFELSKYISRRKADFSDGAICMCYIVFNGNAVRITSEQQTRADIESLLQRMKP